jgi:hypothetical protein
MALRKLKGSKINIPKPNRAGGPPNMSGPTVFNPKNVSSPGELGGPGSLGLYNIEDAPPGFTIDDIIRQVQDNGGSLEDAVAIAKEAGVISENDESSGYRATQDAWAKEWKKRNPTEPVQYDGAPLPFDSPQIMQARELERQGVGTASNRAGSEDGWWNDGKDNEKTPIQLPPLHTSDTKLPGEQHPGIDYSSVDRPLPQKRQDRLGIFSSQKESETYGNGVYGGGSVSGLGSTTVNADPTWTGRETTSTSSGLTAKALGISDAAFDQYKEALAKIESGGKYDIMGGSASAVAGGRFGGKYQMGGNEIIAAAKAVGIDPPVKYVDDQRGNGKKVAVANDTFLKDPAMQEKLFDAYTLSQHKSLTGRNEKYNGLSTAEKLSTLGYAHNQGAGGASKWLNTGVAGKDAFGTSGNKYVKAVSSALNGPIGGTPSGNPANMLTRPGDYGFEKNRGETDMQALEQAAWDAQYPVPDQMSVGPTTVEGLASLMNPESRRTEMSSFGFGPEPTHPDGVDGTVAKQEDPYDPYAPKPVQTQTYRVNPATGQMEKVINDLLEGSSSVDSFGGSQDYAVGGGQTRSADNLQNYQQYMQQPTSPMEQFNYPQGPQAGRGTPQYGNTFELQNDRELHGETYGYPEVSEPPLKDYTTGYQKPLSPGGSEKEWETYRPSYTQSSNSPTIPTAQNTRTYSNRKEQESYSTPQYERVPIWGYEYNPNTTKIANDLQSDYEIAAGLAPGSKDMTVAAVKPKRVITGYKNVPVEKSSKSGESEDTGRSGISSSRLTNSPYATSRTQGILQAATGQAAGNSGLFGGGFEVNNLAGNAKDAFGNLLKNPGNLFNPQAAIARAGLETLGNSVSRKPISGGQVSGQGIFNNNGTGAPSLAGATELGSAYDVYADRSDNDTYAVANSGSVVSRDAGTGWVAVTSDVNGKGPVTTIQNDSNLATNRDPSTMTPIWGGSGDGIFMNGDTEGEQSKIVCTAMNEDYGFGSYRNAIWLKYAKDNLTEYHEKGYHAIFRPLLKLGREKSPKLYAALKHIARHRTADLRAEMKDNGKRDTLGRAYRAVLEPVCYIVGRII